MCCWVEEMQELGGAELSLLCNTPSTFQRLMELVLAGLSWEVCLAYLDDVVVFGRTWEEHLQRLKMVLMHLKEAHLNP